MFSWYKYSEFIPAHAADQVFFEKKISQDTGQLLQDLVSGQMSVQIIDMLEMIDVHHQKYAGNPVAQGRAHLLFHRAPVEKPGQGILICQYFQSVIFLPQFVQFFH